MNIRFRIYSTAPFIKADHIIDFTTFQALEALLPKERASIVKLCEGRKVHSTYLVSWMGDHFKFDPCCCISDY